MAITDVIGTIKDYFDRWHSSQYNEIHTKETNKVTNNAPEKDYLIYSGAVKAANDSIITNYQNADTQLQTQIDTINDTELPKKINNDQYARAEPILGLKYAQLDPRGFDPSPLTTYQNGLMTWRDKAEIQSLGKWYECVHPNNKTDDAQYTFKSIDINSTVWVNPALRIVYLKFVCENFKKKWWNEDQKTSNYSISKVADMYYEGSNAKETSFWLQISPVSTIWSPTNLTAIQMGIGKNGDISFKSSTKVTENIRLTSSSFWFYRDGSSYSRWHT